MEASWAILGASWALLGPSCALLDHLGCLGGILGPSWRPSWGYLGHSWGHLGRLGGILAVLDGGHLEAILSGKTDGRGGRRFGPRPHWELFRKQLKPFRNLARRAPLGQATGGGGSSWPSAHPATVPGLWVRGLLYVRWGLVGGLSGASWRQF